MSDQNILQFDVVVDEFELVKVPQALDQLDDQFEACWSAESCHWTLFQ